MEFGSRESELTRAQEFFREAVAADPGFAEAHLHFGRVTGLLGDHARAVASLKLAAAALSDPQLQYYAALFLGHEHEMLGNYDAARDQLQSAERLYPSAQSPLFALTHLVRWTEYFPQALAQLEPVLMEPGWNDEREDPWWAYEVAHARDADQLMDKMRRLIGGLPK
jgi:tetratricopeptide (TPR) repeat protein